MNTIAAGLVVWSGDDHFCFFEALESILNQEEAVDEIFITLNGYDVFHLEVEITRLIRISGFKGEHHLVRNEKNTGLAFALNQHLELCSCEIYMRMDSDDISLPNRVGVFKEFIRGRSIPAVCGSFTEEFGRDGSGRIRRYPTCGRKIRSGIPIASPVSHPTVFLHVKKIMGIGGYNSSWPRCQDLELWTRVLKHNFVIENIPVVLLRFRLTSTSRKRSEACLWEFRGYKNAIKELGFPKTMIVFALIRIIIRQSSVLSSIAYRYFNRS